MSDSKLILRDEYFNGVEPRFDNPNGWTEDEATEAFKILKEELSCSYNIRYMALAHILKKYNSSDWFAMKDKPE